MNTCSYMKGIRMEDRCQILFVHHDEVSRVQKQLGPAGQLSRLAELFKLLGDPNRLRILQALSLAELCVCDLAALLEMSQSAVSHQLRLLRARRLVKYRREGKMAYYSLADTDLVRLLEEGLNNQSVT